MMQSNDNGKHQKGPVSPRVYLDTAATTVNNVLFKRLLPCGTVAGAHLTTTQPTTVLHTAPFTPLAKVPCKNTGESAVCCLLYVIAPTWLHNKPPAASPAVTVQCREHFLPAWCQVTSRSP
jgi:hypothetical protein